MPFCVQCGNQVGNSDRFCGKCGKPQPAAPGPAAALSGVSPRHASMLCYLPWVGWIACIVALAADRFRKDTRVRFHAFQGLYLFVAWLIVDWVIGPALFLPGLTFLSLHRVVRSSLQLVILAAWVIMLIKVSQDEDYHLPILGELADRSVSEQRF